MKHNYVYVPSATMPLPDPGMVAEKIEYWFKFAGDEALKAVDIFEEKVETAAREIVTGVNDSVTKAAAETTESMGAIADALTGKPKTRRVHKNFLIGLAFVASGIMLMVHKHHVAVKENASQIALGKIQTRSTDGNLVLDNINVATDAPKETIAADDAPYQEHWYSHLLARASHPALNSDSHYSDYNEENASSGYHYHAARLHLSQRELFDQVIQSNAKYASVSSDNAFFEIKKKLELATPAVLEINSPLEGVDLSDLRINREYGISPLAAMGEGPGYFHKGVDLQADVGQGVKEALRGGAKVIAMAPSIGGSIGYVYMQSPDGTVEKYLHVNPADGLEVGQVKKQGELIAAVSPTDGHSTGKHLHYQVEIMGVRVSAELIIRNGMFSYNPATYLAKQLGPSMVEKIRHAVSYDDFVASLETRKLNAPFTSYASVSEDFKSDNLNFVIDYLEGGDALHRDNNDAWVNFGVNQKANPDVDVKSMTREEAKQILQTRYIDPATQGITSPALYMVVAQAAILAPGTVQDLLDRSGGDPALFVKLQRQDLLTRSSQQNVQNAWDVRLARVNDRLQQMKTGAIANAPDADESGTQKTPHKHVIPRHRNVMIQTKNRGNEHQPELVQPLMNTPQGSAAIAMVEKASDVKAEKEVGGIQARWQSNMSSTSTTRPGLAYRYTLA